MQTALQPQELDLLKDKIKDINYAILTTLENDGDLHSRPMYTHGVDPDGTLWFFTHASARKVQEIQRNNRVGLSYSDHGSETYVALAGTAQLSQDKAKIDELWVDGLKAWFPEGKDGPDVALLKVQPHQGEYWDRPGGKIVTLFEMAKAAVTGQPDQSQRNEKLGQEQ